jgi:uncharacterized protein YhaN
VRFDRLELSAFGHFTGTLLDLSAPSPGLHLVYGDNEAGKSTALRAIRSFLYGIPHHSRDAFVHAGSELRLGAELRAESGGVLAAVRRKGRKNTLLSLDGAPLDEQRLQALIVDVRNLPPEGGAALEAKEIMPPQSPAQSQLPPASR